MITFWVALLAISMLIYVLLDGFDLGVGILFAAAEQRSRGGERCWARSRHSGTATRPGWW